MMSLGHFRGIVPGDSGLHTTVYTHLLVIMLSLVTNILEYLIMKIFVSLVLSVVYMDYIHLLNLL